MIDSPEIPLPENPDAERFLGGCAIDLNPAPVARSQATRVILDRLTPAEAAALTASTHAGIRLLVLKATAAGAIREDDSDFPAAKAGLAALGIIAEDRWDALFAP